ncbi:MAG TPA: transglycosylase family protein [Ilumatobacteraceae bacterium]|nr:transglycosylase family protein [Ilumatobacteraceae bacterium]
MTPQSPARGVHAHRNLVRRSAAFLVAAVVVGGVPVVAHAITAEPITVEPATEPAPESPAATEPAPAETAPRPDSPIADLGKDLRAAAVPVVEEAVPSEPAPVAEVAPAGTSADQWAALRNCESGGDYSITNPSGKYRGAYQFDRSTWNSVAERHSPVLVGVDPAAASPADQDAMAFALFAERGARPWPHCGRHLN